MCLLVIDRRPRRRPQELVALADGFRESSESWADLLPRLPNAAACCTGAGGRRRGARVLEGGARRVPEPRRAAVLVAQDRQRPRRPAQVGPSGGEGGARRRSTTPRTRRPRPRRREGVRSTSYGAKWPKAVAKITDDLDVLLAFYDYPAEHWIHLRTTNPIESTFATVRLQNQSHQGSGSRPPASRWRSSSSSPPSTAGGCRQRTTPGRPRPCRRHLRQRQARRTTRRPRSKGGDQQAA